MDTDIRMRPIGTVVSDQTILVSPEYEAALYRIDECSRLWILYWMDGITPAERALLKLCPKREPSLGVRGVFALRTPARPNPIGLTMVDLLSVDGLTLTLRGLDARPGTPVIDIKPVIE